MTKKVAIILGDEFEDIELTSPKEALENAGFETELPMFANKFMFCRVSNNFSLKSSIF